MATPKKKHLIELMIEAGVKWPDGAEYAAQDKFNLCVNFYYYGKPRYNTASESWTTNECEWMGSAFGVYLPSLCINCHQTIVTREQYEEAVAVAAVTPEAHQESPESNGYPAVADTVCLDCDNPPSIEQLTADYHAKAAEADRLQSVADEALKAADDALLALEKAGELIGLVISVDAKQKQREQPVITDWRDLQVGDVVELTGSSNDCWKKHAGREMTVNGVYPDHGDNDNQVHLRGEAGGWALGGNTTWRFIHRP